MNSIRLCRLEIHFSFLKKIELSIFAMTEMSLTHAPTADDEKEVNENVDFHVDSTTSDRADDCAVHEEVGGIHDGERNRDATKGSREYARRENPRRGPPQGRHPPSPVLFLPNMSYDAKEADLMELAQQCPAPVKKSFMYMSSTAHHGFLECNSVEDATMNLEWINMQNLEVNGKRVFAEYSKRKNVDDRRTYEERQHARKDEVPERRPYSRSDNTGYSNSRQPQRRDDRNYSARDQYESYHAAPSGYSRTDYPSEHSAYPSTGRRRSRSPPRSYKAPPAPAHSSSRYDRGDYYQRDDRSRQYDKQPVDERSRQYEKQPVDDRSRQYDKYAPPTEDRRYPERQLPPVDERRYQSTGSYQGTSDYSRRYNDYPERSRQPEPVGRYDNDYRSGPPRRETSTAAAYEPNYAPAPYRYSPNESYPEHYRESAGYDRPPADSYRQPPPHEADIPYHPPTRPMGAVNPIPHQVASYQTSDPYGGSMVRQAPPSGVSHPLLSIRASPIGTRPSYPSYT